MYLYYFNKQFVSCASSKNQSPPPLRRRIFLIKYMKTVWFKFDNYVTSAQVTPIRYFGYYQNSNEHDNHM